MTDHVRLIHLCPFLSPLSEPLMAGRLLKVSSLATAVLATSGLYLYTTQQLDPDDLSIIRFGRAAATVSGANNVNVLSAHKYSSKVGLGLLICIYHAFVSDSTTPRTNGYRMGPRMFSSYFFYISKQIV